MRTTRPFDRSSTRTPMDFARAMIGRGEVPDRAVLQEYLKNGGQNLDPLTTAWCAAFVNASLQQAGVQGTGRLNARSFMKWGQPVNTPRPGDIAVFSRGNPNGWTGHVGFFQGYDKNGGIQVLGGNQGNAVSIKSFPADRLLGFRRAGAPDASTVPGPHSETHPMALEPAPKMEFADPHRFAKDGNSAKGGLLGGFSGASAGLQGRKDDFSPSAPVPKVPGLAPVREAVNREAPRTNLGALLAALTEPLEEMRPGAAPTGSVFG